MPQPLAYAYIPQYGVEPFIDSVAGGATLTNDNLIVTLWTAEDKGGEAPAPFVIFDSMLRPNNTNSTEPSVIRPGFEKAFHSRCSAQFYFGIDVPAFTWPVCAVLNPPGEYKQQLVNAVQYIGDSASDPTDLTNYVISKSLQVCLSWQAFGNIAAPGDGINFWLNTPIGSMFSQYIPLQPFGASPNNVLPFLRTNGADGSVPQFFDATTVAGVQAMISAVNRGDFYVAAFLNPTVADATVVEVRYPHSTARG